MKAKKYRSICIRVEPEVFEVLDNISCRQERSRTWIVEYLLREPFAKLKNGLQKEILFVDR
jgi:hypothetical protein